MKPLKAVFFSALLLFFLLFNITFISCAGGAGSPAGSNSEETSLSVRLPGSKALYDKDDIVTFTVTISSGSYSNTKTAGKGETMTFSNIPAGTYTVTAYGKVADGSVAAKCVTSVQIIAGENTSTTIRLQRLDYYVVTFRNEDGSVISQQNVTTGYTVPKPADPAKTGYNFSGWRTSATATTSFDFNTSITSDTDLVATFGIKTYKITFNYNGGTVGTATSTTVDTDYNTSPTVPSTNPARKAPDDSEYTFMGWNETSDATSILAGLEAATADKTYYAVWSPKVKVTFDYNGGTYSSSNKKEVYPNKDTAPTVPASTEEPSKTGYKFKGWASSSSATTADNTVSTTPVSDDTTYYAVWIPAYTITYSSTPAVDTTGTEFSGKLSYTSDEGLSSLPAPSKTGLTFDGWYTDAAFTPANKVTSIAEGTTGNTTLYAKWTAKVTFDPRNGGSTIESDPITYNGTAASVKPANPTKTHAAFVGWYTGTESGGAVTYSSEYSFTSAVTENITLYAKWDSTEITWVSPVTLPTAYTGDTGAYKEYNSTGMTLPRPEYTGLTFVDWYEDEDFTPAKKVTSIAAGTTGEKTFYAKWTATVTFDSMGGSAVTAQTVIYNKKATAPTAPTKTDADFLGWYTGTVSGSTVTLASDAYDFDTSVTEHITLYAKWDEPFTDFEGTAAEFLAAEFVQNNTAATAYNVKITSATPDEIKQIAGAIANSANSNYKGGVYMNLDLSGCGATTISFYSFYGISTYLTGITLPSSLTSIEEYAFYGCSGITGALVIPDSVTQIGNYAFEDCSGITGTLVIPDSVIQIGDSAFKDCSGITGITLSENLTTISDSAFSYCTGVTGSISIPDSVTSIEKMAFYQCTITASGTWQGYYLSGGTAGIPKTFVDFKVLDNSRYVRQ